MRKFLLSMALVLLTGATMAQNYSETVLTADDLNAITEKTAIAIKCVQNQNSNHETYYNGSGRSAGLDSNKIFYWVPVENETGKFYIMNGNEQYMQQPTGTNSTDFYTFGEKDNAAKLHAINPTSSGTTNAYKFSEYNLVYNDTEANRNELVRIALYDDSKWMNLDKLSTTGTGIWTVMRVYAVAEEGEIEDNPIVTTINPEKYYTLECRSASAHNTTRYIGDEDDIIKGQSSKPTYLKFEDAGNGAFYIKSTESDKYLYCAEARDGASVTLSEEATTAWTLGTTTHTADAVTFTIGNNLYLNNNGGTNSLQVKLHSSGVASNNACSLWEMREYNKIPVEDNITLSWSTTTQWTNINEADYPSVVISENNLNSTDNSYTPFVGYIESEIEIAGRRTATTTFTYSSGNCALNLRGVEVIDNAGNVVAADYHAGKAGSPSSDNVYTVSVAEAGTYKVRCYAAFDGKNRANETNGSIVIEFEKPDKAIFSYNLTFTAEYATLHLGYKTAVPAGVEAYIVTGTDNNYAQMAQVIDVIPAATPVILKKVGSEPAYTFAYTENAATTDVTANKLEGSIADRYVAVDAYVLGNVDEEVGLYTATKNQLTNTAFKNNANKAYLPASAVPAAAQASNGFRFGEGTTGVEKVEIRNEKSEIYDLTGRRVENITAPGIYVVGGRKVLVK